MIEWAISDGVVAYREALDAMASRNDAIRAGHADELVWLLQHPPLYTAGTSARPDDLLMPGFLPVYDAGRGGQYTYHGPGQRIAYLMLDLKKRGGDVRAFVGQLEAWIADVLGEFNIAAKTRPGLVGLWVERRGHLVNRYDKIAAIGLRVRHSVTSHGVSINVEPDLTHYRGIVPCGVHDDGVTSIVNLGLPVSMADVDVALKSKFEARFGAVRATPKPSR